MKIKCFGCGESGEYYPYVPSKVYCFSCYNKVVQERDQLKTENERLKKALKDIFLTDMVSFVHSNYRGEYPVEFAVMNLQEVARRALNEVTK